MRPRTLLALFLVVAALGAFIWFYERKLPSTEKRAELAKKVFPLEAKEVRAVVVEWEGKRVRLERVEEEKSDSEDEEDPVSDAEFRWRMTEPIQARADRWAVDRLVESLLSLEKERTLEEFDREELGLDSPRAKVTLETEKGPRVLEVGSEVPASQFMIVALQGEPRAYAVSRFIYSDLTKEPGEWRDRSVFSASREEVERLSLASGGERLLLARRGEEFWIESPLVDWADRELVDRLLSDLVSLRVSRFLDQPEESLTDLGLDPPRGVLEAVIQGETEAFRLELGTQVEGEEGRYYARAGEQLFEAQTRVAEALERPVSDWRARSWSGLRVFQIDRARVEEGSDSLTLERAGADWKRGEETIPFTPVSDLLYAITDARAERLLSMTEAQGAGADLERPVLTVTLTASDGKEEILSLYPAIDGGYPARARGREPVLLLPEDKVQEIREKLAAVREAEPLKEGADPGSEEDEDEEE